MNIFFIFLSFFFQNGYESNFRLFSFPALAEPMSVMIVLTLRLVVTMLFKETIWIWLKYPSLHKKRSPSICQLWRQKLRPRLQLGKKLSCRRVKLGGTKRKLPGVPKEAKFQSHRLQLRLVKVSMRQKSSIEAWTKGEEITGGRIYVGSSERFQTWS